MFVGYAEGTKGGIFYSPEDKKVIVSTHAIFLEEDYMKEHKPRSKIILEELSSDTIATQSSELVPQQVKEQSNGNEEE